MFEYAFMQNAFIVAILISLVCPLIGMFLVLRRYSMIGDSLAHASLAGVALGLLLDLNPILSAFGLTSFFGLLIEALRQRFRQYAELILVIILSLSVGIAITIISSGVVHANVESFLFGSILTVTRQDVWSVLFLSVVSLAMIVRLYPQLVLLTFDEDGAKIAGVRYRSSTMPLRCSWRPPFPCPSASWAFSSSALSLRCPWRRPCSSRKGSGAPWSCLCCSASSTSWGAFSCPTGSTRRRGA